MSPTAAKLVVLGYRAGAAAGRLVPHRMVEHLANLAGPLLARLMPRKAAIVRRHQERALRWQHAGQNPRKRGDAELRRATAGAFASYARYWLESLRLPVVKPDMLDRFIEVPGYHHIEAALERGNGAILAMPHLGGWEWAGFWGAAHNGLAMTVVVEPLDPPELFAWFADFRERLGMRVIPLGPAAGREVLAALGRNEIVCLLCDRDLTGDGIEVTFGDERTTLPAGPAMLALRTGAALLPTAVYFGPRGGHHGEVRPPLDATRKGRLRDDVAALTQQMADALASLISAAPQQWHLFGPNWPSDLAAA